jgi:hypothetical protein
MKLLRSIPRPWRYGFYVALALLLYLGLTHKPAPLDDWNYFALMGENFLSDRESIHSVDEVRVYKLNESHSDFHWVSELKVENLFWSTKDKAEIEEFRKASNNCDGENPEGEKIVENRVYYILLLDNNAHGVGWGFISLRYTPDNPVSSLYLQYSVQNQTITGPPGFQNFGLKDFFARRGLEIN